jgi:isoquinoline 1-oxidoreductase subunit beta
MAKSMTRRAFLKKSMATTGLTIAVSVTPFGFKLLNASGKGQTERFKPNVWFEITPDNNVSITIGASEMGQGTHTSLAMVIADELEADWSLVNIRQGGARKEFINPIMHSQIAVASSSVRGFYAPLRKAGAAGRAVLVKAAAATWKVPEKDCQASKGTVLHLKSNKSLTYGELCQKAAKLPLPKDPPLKKESDFRYMGKFIPRLDIPPKVNGKAVYGIDFKVKDMLYAVLDRPPAYGSKHISFDQKAAEAVKGVKKVFPIPQGIVVCAESLAAAWKGRDALKVKWDGGALPQMDNAYIEKSLIGGLDKPGSIAENKGDAKKALQNASKRVKSTYFVPFVAHTNMEPMNCAAHVRKDGCDIWAPTQAQTIPQMIASQITGLPPEKINIHTTYMGTGLGRRAAPDFIIEAVIIGKVMGKPVKVVWTREEDTRHDPFRAAVSHRIEAGLDSRGRLTAWSHKAVAGSIMKDIDPKGIKNGVDIMSLWGILDFPNSIENRITYDIPNFLVEFLISDLPIPVCPWRSVQNGPNAFAIESFVDELAHAAGKDPLEFRLEALKTNKRATRVLKAVAQMADWGKSLPKGQGRGIAQHACFGSYVAQVADITVNEKDGTFKVDRVFAAVDCGPAVNPFNIKTQIEGAITMALSTVLREEVMFSNGGVKSANFDDYSPIRITEVPDIEVQVIRSNDKIGGIGEPGVPPLAPAVGNAIFNATGARLRRIPMTPERVLEALKKA